MLILVKSFKKTLIFLKISENLDFVKIIEKCWFGNNDFDENCRKILNLVKMVDKTWFWEKLSKILDFS